MSDDARIQLIRDLLSEFTNYPCTEPEFTINDHMFLDFEFWGALLTIIDWNK